MVSIGGKGARLDCISVVYHECRLGAGIGASSHSLVRYWNDLDLSVFARNPSAVPMLNGTGNAYFYYLKELPGNFSKICDKIFDMLSASSDAVFSTDMYSPNSVKSMECDRRGCSAKLIIKGPGTKKPPNWKLFLANDENKTQFISLLCTVWSNPTYASNCLLYTSDAADE